MKDRTYWNQSKLQLFDLKKNEKKDSVFKFLLMGTTYPLAVTVPIGKSNLKTFVAFKNATFPSLQIHKEDHIF